MKKRNHRIRKARSGGRITGVRPPRKSQPLTVEQRLRERLRKRYGLSNL